jgi:hypothetical protein
MATKTNPKSAQAPKVAADKLVKVISKKSPKPVIKKEKKVKQPITNKDILSDMQRAIIDVLK